MTSESSQQTARILLLIAASRGLGLAMAEEFLKKGWNVVGTVRAASGRTKLHDLAGNFPERLQIANALSPMRVVESRGVLSPHMA